MADAPRPRPIEYYNPRPLILAACFLWGVAMGFCMFYFSPPKQMAGAKQDDSPVEAPKTVPDRNDGVPVITEVALTPQPKGPTEPLLKTMILEPPLPVISTEGGLTGRTAQPLSRQSLRPYSSPEPQRAAPPPVFSAPPIPELMP